MAYSNLGITEAAPFDPAQTNVWAATVNTNMTLLDNAIAGVLTLDISGSSNVVLTATAGTPNQFRNASFAFTGALTGNVVVLWPTGVTIKFTASNATTGAYKLSVAANNGSGSAAGTAVVVPSGGTISAVSDGADVLRVAPAGRTRTVLTSGSAATYPIPFGCTGLYIRMVGGGGGGQGVAVSELDGNGGAGGNTSFSSFTANGGAGGVASSASAGGTGGAGSASFRIAGGGGQGGSLYGGVNPVQTQAAGQNGAASPFGGAGAGQIGGSNAAVANSGAGGSGASYADVLGGGNYQALGGAGAAGEYVELIINNPSVTYTYTVGAAGAAGSGTFAAGGAGGSGVIIIDEYYS